MSPAPVIFGGSSLSPENKLGPFPLLAFRHGSLRTSTNPRSWKRKQSVAVKLYRSVNNPLRSNEIAEPRAGSRRSARTWSRTRLWEAVQARKPRFTSRRRPWKPTAEEDSLLHQHPSTSGQRRPLWKRHQPLRLTRPLPITQKDN